MKNIRVEILKPEGEALLKNLVSLNIIRIDSSEPSSEEILKSKLLDRAQQSEKDIKNGNVYSLDEARKELSNRIIS